MIDPDACLYGDWLPWIARPPKPGEYEVIEWLRGDDIDPTQQETDATVSNLAALLHPRNAAWNVAGIWWRPVG